MKPKHRATLRGEPTIDFQTAQGAKLSGVKDEEVLALAPKGVGFS